VGMVWAMEENVQWGRSGEVCCVQGVVVRGTVCVGLAGRLRRYNGVDRIRRVMCARGVWAMAVLLHSCVRWWWGSAAR